jgi:hypothetical protein
LFIAVQKLKYSAVRTPSLGSGTSSFLTGAISESVLTGADIYFRCSSGLISLPRFAHHTTLSEQGDYGVWSPVSKWFGVVFQENLSPKEHPIAMSPALLWGSGSVHMRSSLNDHMECHQYGACACVPLTMTNKIKQFVVSSSCQALCCYNHFDTACLLLRRFLTSRP